MFRLHRRRNRRFRYLWVLVVANEIDVSMYERKDIDLLSSDEGETSSIMRIRKESGDKKLSGSSTLNTEQPDTVLYLREINKYTLSHVYADCRCLALICILPVKAMEDHGLLEYNVQCFKDAIQSIFGLQGR